jgi:Xaa-Pro aminopeptidase
MTDATREELRLDVIEALARKASPRLGRTAIMKCLYFLQEARGVPLGYRFTLYTYGPFDAEVLGDLAYAESQGRVRAETVTFPSGSQGYEYAAPSRRGTRLGKATAYAADVEWVLSKFGHHSAGDLETASTLHFVDRHLARDGQLADLASLASYVHDIKPHLERAAIEREARRLMDMALLRAAA